MILVRTETLSSGSPAVCSHKTGRLLLVPAWPAVPLSPLSVLDVILCYYWAGEQLPSCCWGRPPLPVQTGTRVNRWSNGLLSTLSWWGWWVYRWNREGRPATWCCIAECVLMQCWVLTAQVVEDLEWLFYQNSCKPDAMSIIYYPQFNGLVLQWQSEQIRVEECTVLNGVLYCCVILSYCAVIGCLVSCPWIWWATALFTAPSYPCFCYLINFWRLIR